MKWESKFTEKTTTLTPSVTCQLIKVIWALHTLYWFTYDYVDVTTIHVFAVVVAIRIQWLVANQLLYTYYWSVSSFCQLPILDNVTISHERTHFYLQNKEDVDWKCRLTTCVTRNLLHYEKFVSRRELLADQYGLRNCLLESDNFIHSNHILVLTFVWPLNLFL